MPIEQLQRLLNTDIVREKANAAELLAQLQAAETPYTKLQAWSYIAAVLADAYQIAHDKLELHPALKAGLINDLDVVTNSCLEDFYIVKPQLVQTSDEQKFLARIFQLPFTMCKFYSTDDDLPQLETWKSRTSTFLVQAELTESSPQAEFDNFCASEASRRYTMNPRDSEGNLKPFPRESIDLVLNALRIEKNNGLTLDNEATRHKQNNLGGSMAKEILEIVQRAEVIDDTTMSEIRKKSAETFALLDQIEPYFLPEDISLEDLHADYNQLDISKVRDPKRLSNLLAVRGLIELLNGKISPQTFDLFETSVASMPLKDFAQAANVRNRFANFCLAFAAVEYNHAGSNGNEFISYNAIKQHPYVVIANKLYAFTNTEPMAKANPNATVIHIENAVALIARAVRLLCEAYDLTNGKAGSAYGKEAVKSLMLIQEHPECQKSTRCLAIIAENQPKQGAAFTPALAATSAPSLSQIAMQGGQQGATIIADTYTPSIKNNTFS